LTTVAIDVFIVAGVRLYREGLAQAFVADARFRVLGAAADHAGGLARMACLAPRPSVAMLDAGGGSGAAGARRLRAALPDVRLVALLTDETDDGVVEWAEAGVEGFVTPETSLEELKDTVACVAGGGALCPPAATAALLRRIVTAGQGRRGGDARSGKLTPREREIVALIDRGMSNKQIARELQIELATVKNHVHSVLEKLQVERRGAAAAVMRTAVR
jgi:DNA-binding NarL/FixJ family response regulator